MAGGHLPFAAVLAQELSDDEATRRVLLTAGGLVLIGLALLVATVWWWRGTRPDPPVLAPLEVMSGRRWMKAGLDERQRMVDTSRPASSLPTVADPAASDDDLSVPAGGVPRPPDDLAELDRILGLAPGSVEHRSVAQPAPTLGRTDHVAQLDAGEAGEMATDAGSGRAGTAGSGAEVPNGNGNDSDDAVRAAIDPLLQRTSAVAKD